MTGNIRGSKDMARNTPRQRSPVCDVQLRYFHFSIHLEAIELDDTRAACGEQRIPQAQRDCRDYRLLIRDHLCPPSLVRWRQRQLS